MPGNFTAQRIWRRQIPPAARAAYRALIKLAPGFAASHFRLARLLEQAGEWGDAGKHYVQARECDAMPLRCPEEFRQAYREVAARYPEVILVDGPRVLEPLSPHGILDDHLFHDAQHLTLLGYIALAQDLLRQLRERHAFERPRHRCRPSTRTSAPAISGSSGTMGPGLRAGGVVLQGHGRHPS